MVNKTLYGRLTSEVIRSFLNHSKYMADLDEIQEDIVMNNSDLEHITKKDILGTLGRLVESGYVLHVDRALYRLSKSAIEQGINPDDFKNATIKNLVKEDSQ